MTSRCRMTESAMTKGIMTPGFLHSGTQQMYGTLIYSRVQVEVQVTFKKYTLTV